MGRMINIFLIICGLLFLIDCSGYLDEVKDAARAALFTVTEALE